MPALLRAAKGHMLQLRRLLRPSWRGVLLKTSYVTYALLLAACVVDHLSFGPPALVVAGYVDAAQATGVQSAIRTVFSLWSVALVLHAFRSCVGGAARPVKIVEEPPAGPRRPSVGAGGPGPSREKLTRSGRGFGFEYASCEMQGWRAQMEDALVCAPDIESAYCATDVHHALFGVMDGHGGSEVSCHVAQLLVRKVRACIAGGDAPGAALKRAVLAIEEDLRRANAHGWRQMGCTAAIALLSPTSVSVANVGDSRVFKCRGGTVMPLTRDHRPESPRERRRIEAAGGTVAKFGPTYRVDALLNMSRALGDFSLKDPKLPHDRQMISPVPDITVSDISADDEFLVVACDGLFELMSWETVCEYIHSRIRTRPLPEIAEGLLDACCTRSVQATQGRGTDNESVIIVKLHTRATGPQTR